MRIAETLALRQELHSLPDLSSENAVERTMLKAPNLFLGLVRIAGWLFWRDPVAKPEPTPPKPFRKPVLAYTIGDIPTELMAVIRIEWLKGNGSASEVEEYQIEECPDAQAQFSYVVGTALRQGADVCVLTQYQPVDLGVDE